MAYIIEYIRIYMGKPLMIQEDDNRRLESLKKALGAKSKVQVLRDALDALDRDLQRERRIRSWKRSAALVRADSARVNREFQPHSRLKSHD